MNFDPLFREQNLSTTDILYTFYRRETKFGSVRDLANRHLFPEFHELWSGGPVILCGDMHQSFTGSLVKCFFFDDFPMLADSFSAISIHCNARILFASFLYKCRASHGGWLRQHGLLVYFFLISVLRSTVLFRSRFGAVCTM